MILLDTNIVSELMRPQPDPAVLGWLDARPRHHLYLSAVTRAEIELGIALLPEGYRKQGLRAAALGIFTEFAGRFLAFEERSASRYATLVAARIKAGTPISVEDGQIAAVALVAGFTVATRNTADFSGIEGLALVDPFNP